MGLLDSISSSDNDIRSGTLSPDESLELISKLKQSVANKNSENTDHKSVNITSQLVNNELLSPSFNEVDYATMLMNTHIRMALRNLSKGLIFPNPVLAKLRDIIINDESGSTQRVISQLYVTNPSINMDGIKKKLDFYNDLGSREDINHYLGLINARIKRDVLDTSLNRYFDDKNLDNLIGKIDTLTENIHNAIIPFTGLGSISASDITESYDDSKKLYSFCKRLNQSSNFSNAMLKGQMIVVSAPPMLLG